MLFAWRLTIKTRNDGEEVHVIFVFANLIIHGFYMCMLGQGLLRRE